MFCHDCGTEIPDGKKFCRQCGAALRAANLDHGAQTTRRPPYWLVGIAVSVSLIAGGAIGYAVAARSVSARTAAAAVRAQEQSDAYAREQRAAGFDQGYDAGARSTEVPKGQFVEIGNGFSAKPSSGNRYYFVRFAKNPSGHNVTAPLAIAEISNTTYVPTRWTAFRSSTWDVGDW